MGTKKWAPDQTGRAPGYDRHIIIGRVGAARSLDNGEGGTDVTLTIAELDGGGRVTDVWHQTTLVGADALKAESAGIARGDVVIVSLEELRARAYIDNSGPVPAAVGYFASRGSDPFVLERASDRRQGQAAAAEAEAKGTNGTAGTAATNRKAGTAGTNRTAATNRTAGTAGANRTAATNRTSGTAGTNRTAGTTGTTGTTRTSGTSGDNVNRRDFPAGTTAGARKTYFSSFRRASPRLG
ncbi:MAG: hypothetical protein LBP95_01230 [Deltaproteobacteria bacterium]|nr:hypothetical protein [Deltaproteobacteria bacterium]